MCISVGFYQQKYIASFIWKTLKELLDLPLRIGSLQNFLIYVVGLYTFQYERKLSSYLFVCAIRRQLFVSSPKCKFINS